MATIHPGIRDRDAELALARKVIDAHGDEDKIALVLSDVCETLSARWIVMFRVNTLTREHDQFAVYEGNLAGDHSAARLMSPSPSIFGQLVAQAEHDFGGWAPTSEVRLAPSPRDDRGPEGNPRYAWVQLPAGRSFVYCLGAIRMAASGPFPEAHEAILLRAAWTIHLLTTGGSRPLLPLAPHTEPAWVAITHQMPVGIAVVNSNRELLFCNDAMQTLLAHKDGLELQGNRLVAVRQDEDRKLESLVHRSVRQPTAEASQNFMALVRPAPHSAYGVAIQRMDAQRPNDPAVTIQVSIADKGLELSRAAIRAFFGLTPTESEIAARLADGADISEIAAALEIRPGTVRVHLRSIYRKTHVSRQGELVRLVLCSVARFALR